MLAGNAQGLLSVNEFKNIKMKTIDEVLNTWNAGYVADNPHNVDGYNKADVLEWLAQKHLLQQTQCTALRELLEQMMKDEEQSAAATSSFSKMEKHYANAEDIKNVMRLIKERPPVA